MKRLGVAVEPMDYKYDLFISYRRCPPVGDWVHYHLIPQLKCWLPGPLGRPLSIFYDDGYEAGGDGVPIGAELPWALGAALGRSRCLLPVFSPEYFWSEWCRWELAAMRRREKSLGFRTASNPACLILPVKFSDGINFPTSVSNMDWQDFEPWNIQVPAYMDSREYPDFIRRVQLLCQRLAPEIHSAPPWDQSWATRGSLAPRRRPRPTVRQVRL